MISQPTMQDLFGEPLTYSQRAILANRSARLDADRERKTLAISGRMCAALLTRQDPLGLSVKMLLATSHWDLTRCALTWKPLRTPSNRLLFQLVPQVRRTDETGFGLLPTPKALEINETEDQWRLRRAKPGNKMFGPSLTVAAQMLPTPVASDATTGAIIGKDDTFRMTSGLPSEVNRNGKEGSVGLGRLVALGATPRAQEPGRTTQGHGRGLAELMEGKAQLLPTPTSREHKGPRSPEAMEASGRNPMTNTLGDARSHLLATPTINGNYNRKGLSKTSGDGLATQVRQIGQAATSDNQAHSRTTETEKSGKLSVLFVQWMMGYPPDWLEIE